MCSLCVSPHLSPPPLLYWNRLQRFVATLIGRQSIMFFFVFTVLVWWWLAIVTWFLCQNWRLESISYSAIIWISLCQAAELKWGKFIHISGPPCRNIHYNSYEESIKTSYKKSFTYASEAAIKKVGKYLGFLNCFFYIFNQN